MGEGGGSVSCNQEFVCWIYPYVLGVQVGEEDQCLSIILCVYLWLSSPRPVIVYLSIWYLFELLYYCLLVVKEETRKGTTTRKEWNEQIASKVFFKVSRLRCCCLFWSHCY